VAELEAYFELRDDPAHDLQPEITRHGAGTRCAVFQCRQSLFARLQTQPFFSETEIVR
jgi:hypothetical protein